MRISVSDLKDVIEVYKTESEENDIGETVFVAKFIKKVHASIVETSGKPETIAGDMSRADTSYKIIIRNKAIKDISTDMFFICRGQKLKVNYWYPDYKRCGFIKVFCNLKVE